MCVINSQRILGLKLYHTHAQTHTQIEIPLYFLAYIWKNLRCLPKSTKVLAIYVTLYTNYDAEN